MLVLPLKIAFAITACVSDLYLMVMQKKLLVVVVDQFIGIVERI